eukprot:TRINITY_DN8160_c0_g1_i1.p1 TRINITY_DN8160_c0_g1~~TRINITY_DN8160_c0_g1_i1.p1  ORF type:complete len:107 (+),score=37.19 TRINITY_DN8160_c0_g1_i1:33-323(+)
MKKILLIFCIYLILQASANDKFDEYLKIHGKKYSRREYKVRKQLFEQRYKEGGDLSSPVLDRKPEELAGSKDLEILNYVKEMRRRNIELFNANAFE